MPSKQKPLAPAKYQVGDYVEEAPKGTGSSRMPLASRKGRVVNSYIEIEKKGGSRR